MGKNDCLVCKKTANVCASNKAGSVQCSVCDLWYHPPCVDMSKELYEYINKGKELHGLTSVWTCHVCTTAWTKIQKNVKEVAKIAAANDRRITALEEAKTEDDDKVKKMEERLKKMEDKVDKLEKEGSEESGDKVLEEIAARSSKDRNLVVQKCPESANDDQEMVTVQGIFDKLNVRMEAKHVLHGTRRLGEQRGRENPRPLLLIFKQKDDRDFLLGRAPRLSKESDIYWKEMRIIADLTKKQRDMEAEMFRKAEQSNLRRSPDDISKNLAWKVVGRRGERMLRQYELRDGEEINEDGRVVRRRDETSQDRTSKRPLSPHTGHSPPARRQRAGASGRQ